MQTSAIIEFDPLESAGALDVAFTLEAKKREIRNILKSYVGLFDVFSESIQNGLDSIERRQILNPGTGSICIQIDLNKNQYSIVDNGTGFNENEYRTFLAPNISFNKGNHLNTRGNKGVGATYLAFGYNKLFIATKNCEYSNSSEIINGRNWIEDESENYSKPTVRTSTFVHPFFDTVTSGAAFTIEFGCDYARPKDLRWHQAVTAEQWMYLLTSKTPLGVLSKVPKDVKVKIKVIDGANISEEEYSVNYPYPHLQMTACLNIDTHLAWQAECIAKKKDVSNIPSQHKNRYGIYKRFEKNELKDLLNKKTTRDGIPVNNFIDKYEIWAYGCFVYSTDVWDEINDVKFKLRKNYRLLRGNLLLANNTMIQGEGLVIPLTSNIGYQNQSHIIVHLTNADPDLGRKGFQPEITEACTHISVSIVNFFKDWRKLIKENTGTKGGAVKELQLYDWIELQKTHKASNPLILSSPHFFKPKNQISILSIPQSEQDVIALFNQLLAGGVIRSIELLATSQTMQYDGIYIFKNTDKVDTYLYHETSNPLGVDRQNFVSNFESPPKVLEYKYSINGLIAEFHNQEKRADDIDLSIAWELGDLWKSDYSCTSLLDDDNISHREFHGITHILSNPTSKIYCIILSELIEYLNHPLKSKETQKKYLEN